MLNGAYPNSHRELQGRPYATIARTRPDAIDCSVSQLADFPQLQLQWKMGQRSGFCRGGVQFTARLAGLERVVCISYHGSAVGTTGIEKVRIL